MPWTLQTFSIGKAFQSLRSAAFAVMHVRRWQMVGDPISTLLPYTSNALVMSCLNTGVSCERLCVVCGLAVSAHRYQMAGDPISTLLPYTGDAMDRRLNAHTQVPASSVSFTNT